MKKSWWIVPLVLVTTIWLIVPGCRKSDDRIHAIWADTASTQLIVKINQGGFNLNFYEGFEYELLDLYMTDLGSRFERGRFEFHEDSTLLTEYALRLDRVQFQERLSTKRKCSEDHDLAVLGLSIHYILDDLEGGRSENFNVWLEVRDDVNRNDNNDCEIDATDVDALVSTHTAEARKKVRRIIRDWNKK